MSHNLLNNSDIKKEIEDKAYYIDDINNVMHVIASIDEACEKIKCRISPKHSLLNMENKYADILNSQNDKTKNHEYICLMIKSYEEDIKASKRTIKLLKKIRDYTQYQELRHLIELEPLNVSEIEEEIRRIRVENKIKQ